MLEKDIENLIAQHPDDVFPGEGFKLIGQQSVVEGRRLDIVFEDKHRRKIIVEVKRGILTRDASGQIAEYYGLLKNANPAEQYELVLCANVIPRERRTFLETIGIECKELGIVQVSELARKYDYKFIDDQSTFSTATIEDLKQNKQEASTVTESHSNDQDISVWIFQANPNQYDILNALNDNEIGNLIHWLVRQHKERIHKGHLVLIWMSGKEAGVYALARVECEPSMMPENEPEKKYWMGEDEDKNKIENRVRLSVLRRFVNKPILKKELIKIPDLSRLSILRQCQGTNFPVRDSEWELIAQLM